MSRFFPVTFSFFLVFTALAETTHTHEQACDDPCPSVCVGSASGVSCDGSAVKSVADPKETESRAVFGPESLLAARLSEDEIFHPPLG